MNSQEKQGYIDEINYQKKMIHNLIKWLRNLFFLSSLGVLLMYYFSNILFVKIFAIILIIISILAIILVGKAIYSGKKNINKIVDQVSIHLLAQTQHQQWLLEVKRPLHLLLIVLKQFEQMSVTINHIQVLSFVET